MANANNDPPDLRARLYAEQYAAANPAAANDMVVLAAWFRVAMIQVASAGPHAMRGVLITGQDGSEWAGVFHGWLAESQTARVEDGHGKIHLVGAEQLRFTAEEE